MVFDGREYTPDLVYPIAYHPRAPGTGDAFAGALRQAYTAARHNGKALFSADFPAGSGVSLRDYADEDHAGAAITPAAVAGADVEFYIGDGPGWTSADLGRRIQGNNGSATILAITSGAVARAAISVPFDSTAELAAGTWSLFGAWATIAQGRRKLHPKWTHVRCLATFAVATGWAARVHHRLKVAWPGKLWTGDVVTSEVNASPVEQSMTVRDGFTVGTYAVVPQYAWCETAIDVTSAVDALVTLEAWSEVGADQDGADLGSAATYTPLAVTCWSECRG